MRYVMETQKAIQHLFSQLRDISLYDDELVKQVILFYEHPEADPPITIKKQFGDDMVKFRAYTNFNQEVGLYLQSYSVYVPAIGERPEHFVHNGINSADLEEKMKTIDWKNESGWMQQNDPDNMETKKVQDFFTELNRFVYFGGNNDHRASEKADKIGDYLLFTYLENTPAKQRLLDSQPHLEDIFYRELYFPPHIHSGIVGNRIGDVEELERLSRLAYSENDKNKEIMNLNNLEDLKEEMKTLGFSDELAAKMEERMRANDTEFKLYDEVKATKGRVDIVLQFKRSTTSEFYYLNKYEATHSQAKPLEEGQKYMVITPNGEGKNMVKKFENMVEAITFFKEQKGNSELAAGKDAAHKTMLANMEKGKINYVAKDFQRSFYSQALPQTYWLDHGRGFNREQGANLVQGRYVFRDDMVSRNGLTYQAWLWLDTEKPRDRQQNLTYKTFSIPGYPFDLKEHLESYKIKEMEDPKKAEALETSLKNGNRPSVTVTLDGEQVKASLEAAVRWKNLNFYAENGKPIERELLLKEPAKENSLLNGRSNERQLAESQELGR